MRFVGHEILVSLLLVGATAAGLAQGSALPASSIVADPRNAQLANKIEALSEALAATQQQLEQSQRQMQQLQQQLLDVRQQLSSGGTAAVGTSSSTGPGTPADSVAAESTNSIEERHQVLESAVKILDQTKVESASKYPVRLTGLMLFNGYLNKGVADNADVPAFAPAKSSTSGNGNRGEPSPDHSRRRRNRTTNRRRPHVCQCQPRFLFYRLL